jgi:hypothetical protein
MIATLINTVRKIVVSPQFLHPDLRRVVRHSDVRLELLEIRESWISPRCLARPRTPRHRIRHRVQQIVLIFPRQIAERVLVKPHALPVDVARLPKNDFWFSCVSAAITKSMYRFTSASFAPGVSVAGIIKSLKIISVSFWCSSRNTGFQFATFSSFDASTPRCAGVNSDFSSPAPCSPAALPLFAPANAGVKAAAAPPNTLALNISRRFIRISPGHIPARRFMASRSLHSPPESLHHRTTKPTANSLRKRTSQLP